MRNHQHTPFTHKEIQTRRQKNIHILVEKAWRGNPEAIRELEDEYGIKVYTKDERMAVQRRLEHEATQPQTQIPGDGDGYI